MVTGTPISFSALRMELTASPRATPGAVSNDRFAAGNWETWLICRGAVTLLMVAMVERGVGAPLPARRYRVCKPSGVVMVAGSASRITRYWVDWVKMVEMILWPKAS